MILYRFKAGPSTINSNSNSIARNEVKMEQVVEPHVKVESIGQVNAVDVKTECQPGALIQYLAERLRALQMPINQGDLEDLTSDGDESFVPDALAHSTKIKDELN